MAKNLRILSITFLVTILIFSVYLNAWSTKEVDTYDFLNIGNGARAIGMGGAFVAVADDATATYWNPAGLGLLSKREMIASRIELASNSFVSKDNIGSTHNYLSIAYPRLLGTRWGIGCSLIYFGVGQIQRIGTDDYGEPEPTNEFFQNSEFALIASCGREAIKDWIWIGGSLKGMYHGLDDISGKGFGVDVGVLANLSPILSAIFKSKSRNFWIFNRIGFGTAFQLNSSKRWNDVSGSTDPGLLREYYGISFEPAIGENARWIISIAADQARQQRLKISAGTEFRYKLQTIGGSDLFVVGRFGLRNQYIETRQHGEYELAQLNYARQTTLGGGIQLDGIFLDYAFVWARLANRHRISLRVRF